jgi:putative glycosyltransferase (TIGR04372 family)
MCKKFRDFELTNIEDNPNIKYSKALLERNNSLIRKLRRKLQIATRSARSFVLTPIARYLASRGVRVFNVSGPSRIGHFAAEPDWYLKQVALGEREATRPILLLRSKGTGVNLALLDIWREHFDVIDGGWRFAILRQFKYIPELTINGGDGVVAITGAADYARVLDKWGSRPPLVKLPSQQEQAGRDVLARLGVPGGAWFVCLHVREGGYSPRDEFIHSHRNSDISTYKQAAQEIARRGGWVIRMGDASMTPLPTGSDRWPNTVDYALSDSKSFAADVFLCARTRFFLGDTSGLFMVSAIFGIPCVLTNVIPHGMGMGPTDIAIPKILEREAHRLSFPDILSSDIGYFRMAELYRDANLTVIDNSPDEIHAVAVEILDRIEGQLPLETAEETKLQQAYRELFKPDHYCYHSAGTIGRAFLTKHAALMNKNEN